MKTVVVTLNFCLIGILLFGFFYMREMYIAERNTANRALDERSKEFWRSSVRESELTEQIERLTEVNKFLANKVK